jgi:hypothetical protein
MPDNVVQRNLRCAVKSVGQLRDAYRQPGPDLDTAGEIIRETARRLRQCDRLRGTYAWVSPSVLRAAPRSRAEISRHVVEAEKMLGRSFRYDEGEVQAYIDACATASGWSDVEIITFADLAQFMQRSHDDLVRQFAGAQRGVRDWWRRRALRSRADRFVFATGVLLANSLNGPDLPGSYGIFRLLTSEGTGHGETA